MWSYEIFREYWFSAEKSTPGANPTIANYNVIAVNFYNATGSLARFENKKYFILLCKTL
jgi:hypothetical protein